MRAGKTILFISIITVFTVLPGIAPSLYSHELGNEYGHVHIRGRLTTPDGNPITGARVLWREGARSSVEGGRIHPTYTGGEGGENSVPRYVSDPPPLASRLGGSSPESRPGGSPIRGLNKNCLYRPPGPGAVRTGADGRYELIFLIKNEEACIRSINTLRREGVNVYLEKEGYSIGRKPGISSPPVRAPVPGR